MFQIGGDSKKPTIVNIPAEKALRCFKRSVKKFGKTHSSIELYSEGKLVKQWVRPK